MFVSTQVFGSLVEDDSLTENMSPPYEGNGGEVQSPRRLTASAMSKLSKAARALSFSVGDSGNDIKEENGPIFDIEDTEPEDFEAVSDKATLVRVRQWAVVETSPSRDEHWRETVKEDSALESKGENTLKLDTASEGERRANGVNEGGCPPAESTSRETSAESETSQGIIVEYVTSC